MDDLHKLNFSSGSHIRLQYSFFLVWEFRVKDFPDPVSGQKLVAHMYAVVGTPFMRSRVHKPSHKFVFHMIRNVHFT